MFDLTSASHTRLDSVERCLEVFPPDRFCFGQILVQKTSGDRFLLNHREDEGREDLQIFRNPEDTIELARYDDAGNYRPLKTAPNFRHGWRLEIASLNELRRALDNLYPGRLGIWVAWNENRLTTTPLRHTLKQQSGIYRAAAKISDKQIDDLVGEFCRSNGGCLRTILWKRDGQGTLPSSKLPAEKFDLTCDQARGSASSILPPERVLPLLCQEACHLLVSAARKVVKGE